MQCPIGAETVACGAEGDSTARLRWSMSSFVEFVPTGRGINGGPSMVELRRPCRTYDSIFLHQPLSSSNFPFFFLQALRFVYQDLVFFFQPASFLRLQPFHRCRIHGRPRVPQRGGGRYPLVPPCFGRGSRFPFSDPEDVVGSQVDACTIVLVSSCTHHQHRSASTRNTSKQRMGHEAGSRGRPDMV